MKTEPSVLCILLVISLQISACEKAPGDTPKSRELRLVSLSPALTDILFDMGLSDNIVGVSKYCILPPGVQKKVVGNMVSADMELLLSVKPSHLLVQGPLDRYKGLKQFDASIQLISFKLLTISQILSAIHQIGILTGRTAAAAKTISSFEQKLRFVRTHIQPAKTKRVAFIIDSSSHGMMVAGPNTFIDELIENAKGINVGRFVPGKEIWRKTDTENLLAAKPEILICQVGVSSDDGEAQVAQKWSRYIGQPGIALQRVEVVTDRRWTFPSTTVADLALPMAKLIHPSFTKTLSETPSGKAKERVR